MLTSYLGVGRCREVGVGGFGENVLASYLRVGGVGRRNVFLLLDTYPRLGSRG